MKKFKQLGGVWIMEGSDHLWWLEQVGPPQQFSPATGGGARVIISRPNRFRELWARSGNMDPARLGAEKKSKCLLWVEYLISCVMVLRAWCSCIAARREENCYRQYILLLIVQVHQHVFSFFEEFSIRLLEQIFCHVMTADPALNRNDPHRVWYLINDDVI